MIVIVDVFKGEIVYIGNSFCEAYGSFINWTSHHEIFNIVFYVNGILYDEERFLERMKKEDD